MNHSTKKDEVRALWKLCFDEDDSFLDPFFDKVYQEETTFVREEDGKIVAHLQCPQLTLREKGRTLQAGYILGACTHPDYRGRGYMKELLNEVLRKQKERGDILSLIIPADDHLMNYYERAVGFLPVGNCIRVTDRKDVLAKADPDYTAPTLLDYLCGIEERTEEAHLTHSRAMWEVILRDFEELDDHYVWEYRDASGQVAGAVFVIATEEECAVDPIFGSREAREALLDRLDREAPRPIDAYYLPTSWLDDTGKSPLFSMMNTLSKGMVRVLDMPAYLQHSIEVDPETGFGVGWVDHLFPENSAYYHVTDIDLSSDDEDGGETTGEVLKTKIVTRPLPLCAYDDPSYSNSTIILGSDIAMPLFFDY